MTERAANVALYAFEPAQLASDTFEVVRFEGTEGLSQLFNFDLHLVSTNPDIDFAKVVNKPATFTMTRADEDVPVNGIVTDFSLHGRTADYITYRATLQPRLHRLSLSYRSRIFQDVKVEDILRTVLKEDGLTSSDFRFALKGSYAPREYCVQYQETDLNFIDRLMEFEGMYYFFEHADGQDTLVITDQKSEHEKIGDPAALRYHDGGGGMIDEERETVKQFVCEEQVVTGTVQLKDYNYRTPETMTTESAMNGDMPGTRYEYGEHFREKDRGKRLAEVRNEEIEAQRRTLTGESNSIGLRSGYLFTLENHYRKSLNADYLLTQIQHRGSQRVGLDLDAVQPHQDGEPELEYRNRFTCIPATVQYRPPRETPKPEVPGVLTAKVESAGGDYAYIDDQGRYRAQMHFDQREDRSDGAKTPPIRMKQAYSGSDYGIHFPNHADTEMLIAHENGDIDRPVALGTTPNPSNTSPAVSDNKMQNVVRSWAGNQLIMDDTNDETQVQLNTPDANELLLDDKDDRIRLATTDKHTATLDDKNKNIKVQTKDGHVVLLDDENEKVTVQSKNGHFISIDDDEETLTLADESGDNTFSIDIGSDKLTIESANGDIDILAPNGTVDIEAKELECETTGDTTFEAANIKSKAQSDHEMKATNITEEASMDLEQSGMNVTSEAQMEHAVKGMNVAAEAQMKHDVKGTMLTVQASGVNTIKGSMVKIN
jgi:type VI secretion system secreted protein VgrG